MRRDDSALPRVERGGFQQHRGRDEVFADVVQAGADFQFPERRRIAAADTPTGWSAIDSISSDRNP